MGDDALLRREGNGKLKVALDVDGVLALYHQVLAEIWGGRTGKPYTVEDIDEWDMGLSRLHMPMKDNLGPIYNDIWNNRRDQIVPTVSEARLKRFMDEFDVTLVTQRGEDTMEPLRAWLKDHFPSITFRIVTTKTVEDKINLGYDVHIDDANPLADAFLARQSSDEKRLYLITQPWNRGKYKDGVRITVTVDLDDAMAHMEITYLRVAPPVKNRSRSKA